MLTHEPNPRTDLAFLSGGGSAGALMRSLDWSRSPLGPPWAWPPSLAAIVGLMLGSKFPMFVAWGDDLGFLYNDAYAEILGAKHPAAMGARFRDIWAEIWSDISPLIDAALAGEATFRENLPLLMNRYGFDEQTWFTFSYSPARDDRGAVAGMFCTCQETTEQVLSARRQAEAVERQRRQFEQAPGFICTLRGPDHVFDFVNDAHRRLFGDRDAVGRPVREVFPELQGQGYFELLDEVYRTGRRHVAHAMTARLRERPDQPLHLDFIFAPITEPDGRVTGIFCEGHDVTRAYMESAERARAEAALRERENELRLLADALPVLVAVVDTDLVYRFVNRRYEDWFPLTREQIVGRPIRDVVGDEAFAKVEGRFRSALAGERVSFEQAMPYRDTASRHIRVEFVPRQDAGGVVTGFYSLVQDISEAKRAEEALRASEEQLRLATDAAGIGLWDLDVLTGTIYWTPRVRAVFGMRPDEPVGIDDFYPHIHPGDHDRVRAAFDAATDPRRRAVYNVEYRTIGKRDGRLRWVSAKGRGYFDDAGRCVRVLGTTIDITQQKADEARLRELNETLERRVAAALAERKLLADIVDGTDMLVQVIDRDYRWLAINRAAAEEFARIFQVPVPQAGDGMLDVLSAFPEQQEAVRQLWARALDGEEFTSIARFGEPSREYEMRFRTLRDEAGRPVGAYQFVHDVSDRLREQARLREAEAALTQVQKMEAIGQLTGGIAHDFNNLLGAVVSGFELIRRKSEDPERVRILAGHGLEAAERGAKLTAQLLAFSRAQRMELKPLVVASVVGNMQELLARTLGPMVRLHFDLQDGGVPVLSDPVQLEMAVLNLAINARDAMPGGGDLAIVSRLRRVGGDAELAAGDYVELAVTDNGTGMPPEVAARAFDPFFTTKGVGRGTGLGLSQVYGIARQAGGTARIESTPGAGTTVRLFLARTDALPDSDEPLGVSEPAGHAARATVLVVDDDQDLRRMLVASLDAIGYRVLEAPEGRTALDLLDAARPDLVLLDFAMPGMNGAEVAAAIRARRRDLPIVFASGYADTAAIEAAAPGTPVLRKPFRIDDLQATLEAALANRPSGGAPDGVARPA